VVVYNAISRNKAHHCVVLTNKHTAPKQIFSHNIIHFALGNQYSSDCSISVIMINSGNFSAEINHW